MQSLRRIVQIDWKGISVRYDESIKKDKARSEALSKRRRKEKRFPFGY